MSVYLVYAKSFILIKYNNETPGSLLRHTCSAIFLLSQISGIKDKKAFSFSTVSLPKSRRGLPHGLSYITMFIQTVKFRQATTHYKQEHTNTKMLEGAVLHYLHKGSIL